MWIISVDETYYPYIIQFKSEEEAKNRYDKMIQRLDRDKETAIFLAEVKEYATGADYEIEFST